MKNFLQKLVKAPIAVKAFHTFWQAFTVVFLGGLVNLLSAFRLSLSAGESALLALILAAAAAGLSALKTMIQAYLAVKGGNGGTTS